MIVTAFGILPTIALAGHTFTDVPDTNVHHANSSAIAEAGVTLGCTATEYCPSDPVRRDAMGSFLARLGGLGDNPPVVNAASAVTAASGGHPSDISQSRLPGEWPLDSAWPRSGEWERCSATKDGSRLVTLQR